VYAAAAHADSTDSIPRVAQCVQSLIVYIPDIMSLVVSIPTFRTESACVVNPPICLSKRPAVLQDLQKSVLVPSAAAAV
jgi:hypothetical protein